MTKLDTGLCFPEDENIIEKTASEVLAPLGGYQATTCKESFEDKEENSEVSQVENHLVVNTEITKEVSEPVELTFREQMEREIVATNYSAKETESPVQQIKNVINKEAIAEATDGKKEPSKNDKILALQRKACLDWENPEGAEANFKPLVDNSKRIVFMTDTRVSKQYRVINIECINPASYANTNVPEDVELAFLQSMVESGQITPIGVVKSKHHKYFYDVIPGQGRKRVKALRQKGEDLVMAIKFDCENKHLMQLIEVDEALIKVDATVIERCRLLQKRRRIVEKLYPEAKPENQRLKGLNMSSEIISRLKEFEVFTKSAAEILGKDKRTIEQELQIAENITVENQKLLEGSFLENKKIELLHLSRIKDPELQTKVLKAVLENKAKKVNDALALYKENLFYSFVGVSKNDDPKQLRFNLKNTERENLKLKQENTQLKKEKDELYSKVNSLQNEVNKLNAQLTRVPEFNLYPSIGTNKQVIHTGGRNE